MAAAAFDIQTKIEWLESEEYNRYKQGLKTKDGLIFKTIRGMHPPILKNVNDTIRDLMQTRKELMIKFYDMYTTIVATNESNKYRHEYTNIINQIQEVDVLIDKIQAYYSRLNQKSEDDTEQVKTALYEITSQPILTVKDKSKFVDLYKKYMVKNEKPHRRVDFYIEKLPEFHGVKKVIDEKPETPPPPPKQVIKKVTKEQVKDIKVNVKKLMEETFAFKNKDECVSQKRSQAYYMSKENLLKEIEKKPELRALLPERYKTLSKEQICEYLFKDSQKN